VARRARLIREPRGRAGHRVRPGGTGPGEPGAAEPASPEPRDWVGLCDAGVKPGAAEPGGREPQNWVSLRGAGPTGTGAQVSWEARGPSGPMGRTGEPAPVGTDPTATGA
jgi:hypothetical protein